MMSCTNRPSRAAWSYSNTNYALLAMIVKASTGKTIDAELQARLFAPLRLRSTSFPTLSEIDGSHTHGYVFLDSGPFDVTPWSPSASGAAGAIVSNVDDLARFYRALLDGQLLPRTLLKSMRTIDPTATGEAYVERVVSRVARETPLPYPTATPLPDGLAVVSIVDFAYMPSQVRIHVGQTVVWRNDGRESHDVTGTDDWHSGPIEAPVTYRHTFGFAPRLVSRCDARHLPLRLGRRRHTGGFECRRFGHQSFGFVPCFIDRSHTRCLERGFGRRSAFSLALCLPLRGDPRLDELLDQPGLTSDGGPSPAPAPSR